MKKLIVVLTLLLVITGCSSSTSQDNTNDHLYEQYSSYLTKLENNKEFDSNSDDFNINLILNKTNKGNTRYDIIIDEPKEEMKDIKAIIKTDNDKDETYPSIGLLEEETYSLIPGKIDKKNYIVKGLNLSGISTKSNFNVLIYITYKRNDILNERYLKLNANASR